MREFPLADSDVLDGRTIQNRFVVTFATLQNASGCFLIRGVLAGVACAFEVDKFSYKVAARATAFTL